MIDAFGRVLRISIPCDAPEAIAVIRGAVARSVGNCTYERILRRRVRSGGSVGPPVGGPASPTLEQLCFAFHAVSYQPTPGVRGSLYQCKLAWPEDPPCAGLR